ncbi:lasso peptide biosynthesis PqqD family chaperone [Paenibacillus aurantiacus]|uniref:Lasso peptide biosynthesis PqqD family chaperone n=1 Tax=Paenibacillus aurantiacus TaxID=1936118 RepID=A0ABV5KIJ9_9BACL
MGQTYKVELDDRIVQEPGNIVSDMDGETVMLSIERGKYYNFSEVGGSIWQAVRQPSTVREVVAAIMAEYEVDEQECRLEVVAYLEKLLAEGLVTKR